MREKRGEVLITDLRSSTSQIRRLADGTDAVTPERVMTVDAFRLDVVEPERSSSTAHHELEGRERIWDRADRGGSQMLLIG